MTTNGTIHALAARLRGVLDEGAVITDRAQLRTYECDGLTYYKVVPALVVLPRTTEQVAAVVQGCLASGVPYVARGSGTGLSGGALPHAEGVLIVMSQMREILDVDIASERAVVQPGVINLNVTRAAAPHGYYYAPDPSSQQICSIGGNLAENSGGAHCLKYGFTTNHVTGVELVAPDGEVVRLGGKALDPPGYDLLGAIVGSEGTLGIATEVTVRLMRAPEHVRTLLAAFPTTDEAGAAVSRQAANAAMTSLSMRLPPDAPLSGAWGAVCRPDRRHVEGRMQRRRRLPSLAIFVLALYALPTTRGTQAP